MAVAPYHRGTADPRAILVGLAEEVAADAFDKLNSVKKAEYMAFLKRNDGTVRLQKGYAQHLRGRRWTTSQKSQRVRVRPAHQQQYGLLRRRGQTIVVVVWSAGECRGTHSAMSQHDAAGVISPKQIFCQY